MKLYATISVVSVMIRMFLLPNPFKCFGDMALMYNTIAEPIIQMVSFFLVGIVYRKGSEPALGSVLFLVTYSALVGLLWIMGLKDFAAWWIAIVIVGLVAIILLIILLKNKLNEKTDKYYWD